MNKKVIGERLKRLRGDRLRSTVCDAVDISISTLQMYENGERMPRDEIKKRLAEYYNVSVDELFFAV